jgi:hypothetical protein
LPLHLPNLDDLRWNELVIEGRSLIPSSADEWTNHNPSDPGITLVELFAYVSGTLMYQLNRITDSDIAAFLSLIKGSEWTGKRDLTDRESLGASRYRSVLHTAVSASEKRHTLRRFLTPVRAVTPEDFDSLTSLVAGAERSKTLPRLNLENTDSNSRWQDAPGHVSVVVLSLSDATAQEVLANVRQALEPARLLTTRVHVVAPRFVPITIRLTIVPQRDVYDVEALRKRTVDKLTEFLDPRRGWFDGKGWPFGKNLNISELYQVAGEVPGVYGVVQSKDSQDVLRDEVSPDAPLENRLARDESGAIKELALLPDEIIEPRILTQNIAIARHV